MANIRKCIYCLKENEEITSDHILPESWYPSSTPVNLEKWQAPACRECNSNLGRIEDDLFKRFSFALDPKCEGSVGLYEKTKRAISPEAGRNEKDQFARQRERERIFKSIILASDIPMSAIVPLGREDNSDRNVGILIKEANLNKFLGKVVRGVNFLFGREKYISGFHEISFAVGQKASVELFGFPFEEYSCGPGIFVRVWEDPEFPPCGIHEIQIWQQLDSLAFIENRILKQK